MRRCIIFLAKCYPQAWRRRYGVEFDALMEDVKPDWRQLINILGGAVKLQLQSGTGLWKIAGLMAAVGMLASVGAWKVAPQRYVSTAQLRVTTPSGGDDAKAQFEQDLLLMLQVMRSRSSLVEMITRPSLNLYRGERQRMPMEDVIQLMRRDIEVRHIPNGYGTKLSLSFAYPDRFKAQTVTRELTARFLESNVSVARNRESLFQDVWHEPAPPGGKVELAEPASDPHDPEPRLPVFLTSGLGLGLILGLLIYAVARQPRVMRQLALYGLAGCAIGGAASFLVPETFDSELVMRITPPLNPKRWYAGTKPEPFLERVERLKHAAWSTLKNGSERNVSIQTFPTTQTVGTLHISATANTPIEAQSLLREVVSGFLDQFIIEEKARQGDDIRFMAEHVLGPHIEILDAPSLPQTPASPNRAVIAGLGLLAGLLTGAVISWRRRPHTDEMTGATTPVPG